MSELFSSLARKCQSKEGKRKFLRTVQVDKALKFLAIYISDGDRILIYIYFSDGDRILIYIYFSGGDRILAKLKYIYIYILKVKLIKKIVINNNNKINKQL